MASSQLAGHGLQREGAPFQRRGGDWTADIPGWEGHGLCACGAHSPRLPSNNARKRWHREHKEQVRAGLAPQFVSDRYRGCGVIYGSQARELIKGESAERIIVTFCESCGSVVIAGREHLHDRLHPPVSCGMIPGGDDTSHRNHGPWAHDWEEQFWDSAEAAGGGSHG